MGRTTIHAGGAAHDLLDRGQGLRQPGRAAARMGQGHGVVAHDLGRLHQRAVGRGPTPDQATPLLAHHAQQCGGARA
jgi:hypothetical protein